MERVTAFPCGANWHQLASELLMTQRPVLEHHEEKSWHLSPTLATGRASSASVDDIVINWSTSWKKLAACFCPRLLVRQRCLVMAVYIPSTP